MLNLCLQFNEMGEKTYYVITSSGAGDILEKDYVKT